MSDKYEVVVTQNKKGKFATALAVGAVALFPLVSQAAELTAIGTGLDEELAASKLITVAIMTLGATLLAMFAGYRYMKRGANSA